PSRTRSVRRAEGRKSGRRCRPRPPSRQRASHRQRRPRPASPEAFHPLCGDLATPRAVARRRACPWTIRWPAGTGVLPTAITGAATRLPSAPCVQTSVPTWIAVTTTSPAGVAICVAAERQIGQLGREPCDLDATDTVPSPATVPLTRMYVPSTV